MTNKNLVHNFSLNSNMIFCAKEDSEDDIQKGSINAYNGGLMDVGMPAPVVVNLENMRAIKKGTPIFKDHNPQRVIGHITKASKSNVVDLNIVFSGANADTIEIIESGKNGFPWQASIGASVGKYQFIEGGKSKTVNGKVITTNDGFYIANNTKLKEVSIVSLGADETTKTIVACQWDGQELLQSEYKGENMTDKKMVEPGIQADEKVEGEKQVDASKVEAPVKTEEPTVEVKAEVPAVKVEEVVEAKEVENKDLIEAKAKLNELEKKVNDNQELLEAKEKIKAMEAKINEDLESVRAARADHVAVEVFESNQKPVLEATAILKAGLSIKDFDKDLQIQARKNVHKTLMDIGREACEMEGISVKGMDQEQTIKAAFSTATLPGIVGQVADKSLIEGYEGVDPTVDRIARVRSVSNFHSHTRYRLAGTGALIQVGQDGDVEHGTLSEDTFTNQAKTWGSKISLSRQNIINDELGAFAEIPSMLGRQAALKKESECYSAITDTASFFTSGHGNLNEGTTTALSIDSLSDAEVSLMAMKDAAGNPINVRGSFLLVPPALKATAQQIFNSTELNETTTANTPKPVNNPHAGMYEPIWSPYLTSDSSTAWYLMANPADVPAIEIAYLNGQTTPMITQFETNGVLGITYMVVYDFGISMQDYKGIIKNTGVS